METTDPGTLADIDSIAKGLGVGGWDVALVGDGAGRGWDKPGGWSCILIDRHGGEPVEGGPTPDARKLFSGGMNFTTVDIAELMPYVQAMLWYDRYYGKARRKQRGKDHLSVLIITDRESIAGQGLAVSTGRARIAEICRRQPLWSVIAQFERQGYRFTWAHKGRNEIALNSVADRMADAAKHAAANALAQANAHVREDLPDAPSEEDLIYLFNTAAFGPVDGATPVRRRKYDKTTRSDGAGI